MKPQEAITSQKAEWLWSETRQTVTADEDAGERQYGEFRISRRRTRTHVFAAGNRGYSQGPDAKHSTQLAIVQSPNTQ